MQQCNHCKISVTGAPQRCPLCQGELTGIPCGEEEVFPVLGQAKGMRLFFKIGIFCSSAAALICLAINFMLPGPVWWAGYVVAGLASVWLLVGFALRKRHNIPKTILWLVVLCSVLALLWDHFTTNNGWAIDYAIPIACSGAMVTLMILPRILRMRVSDYLFYLIIDILFGILPLVFYFTGLLNGPLIPSVICVCIALVSLCALLVFEGREMWQEVTRRGHF
ncbi:MAG: DUF6320 domain-containing protein [Pygmaiobacter sp.]|nr:DUF6320 domain-containing protein [Pygmaiobacter sp.]